MALTHSTALRNSFCTSLAAAVDGGGGAGKIVYRTAGAALVATCIGQTNFFLAPSGGSMAADSINDDTNAVGGIMAVWDLDSFDDATHLDGTVGVGGGFDLTANSVDVSAGQTVRTTAFTYDACP